VIPFLSYTLGLRTVEASKAGILATIEPLVATLVGILVFSEPLTLLSGSGIVLILLAVILLEPETGGSLNPFKTLLPSGLLPEDFFHGTPPALFR
jgi:EamA-like transporter family.